jgi:hypothetical protein
VLKFWGGKILLQYLLKYYLDAEKVLLSALTDIETDLIEPLLALTDSDSDSDSLEGNTASTEEI